MKKIGTSSIVVAAFVGPGTVLTCATAGMKFGYDLAWVLLFATASAYILQSLTAATGILAGKGLGEALRHYIRTPAGRFFSFSLVILGLWIGCAAFELGNLLGAATGIMTVLDLKQGQNLIVLLMALMAGGLLMLNLRILIQVFMLMIGLMGALFVVTMLIVPVDWSALATGLLVPRIPSGSLLTVLALVGTTIVTYNLFLHASMAKIYWRAEPDTRWAWKQELVGMLLVIPIGGIVSLSIMVIGASLSGSGTDVKDVSAFAGLLKPVAGKAAQYLFGLGLFGAGITSAMTAPMAAAAGIRELFAWPDDATDWRYRMVWISVLLTGVLFSLIDFSALQMIIAAQAANGLLLPLIAASMLILLIRQRDFKLPKWYLALGALVTLVCAGLGGKILVWVWGQIMGG